MVKNIFNVFKSNKRIKLSKKLSSSKYIQHEKKGLLSEEDIINQLEDEFVVGPVKLKQISQHFLFEFKKGLENEDYSLAMIPSFVTKLPSGRELGNYLSLDLGGTNFKVSEIFLEQQHQVRVRQKKFYIPETARNADGERLFDFMADSVESFLKETGNALEKEYQLGFTFSFPIRQTGINSGELYLWSKEFNCGNTQGKDVVRMLNDAFIRNKINVHISALVNDTVGILMAGAYSDPQTYIGLVLGEGTNVSYVENIEKIKKWKGPQPESGKMIINTEWGDFDDDKIVLPINKYDLLVDQKSNNPGKHVFEKMISGFYLGEIVRLTCQHLIEKKLLFNGKSSPIFDRPNSFEIQYLSRIERDYSIELSDTKLILQDLLLIPFTTLKDRRIVRRIIELVSIRSARLTACGIVSLLHQMNKMDGCTVAVDNFIYEYPHFINRMRDAVHELLGIFSENVIITNNKNGSSMGASIIVSIINT
jgi:hexokinase